MIKFSWFLFFILIFESFYYHNNCWKKFSYNLNKTTKNCKILCDFISHTIIKFWSYRINYLTKNGRLSPSTFSLFTFSYLGFLWNFACTILRSLVSMLNTFLSSLIQCALYKSFLYKKVLLAQRMSS